VRLEELHRTEGREQLRLPAVVIGGVARRPQAGHQDLDSVVGQCPFLEELDPEEAVPDGHGHVRAVRFRRRGDGAVAGTVVELPARSVLVAAGTTPNFSYEREYPGSFLLDEVGKFFRPHSAVRGADGRMLLEPSPDGFFTSHQEEGACW